LIFPKNETEIKFAGVAVEGGTLLQGDHLYLKRGIKTVDFDSYSKARRYVKRYSQ